MLNRIQLAHKKNWYVYVLKTCLVTIDILNSFKMLYKLLTAPLPRSMANWDTSSLDVGSSHTNGRLLVVSQDVMKAKVHLEGVGDM